MAAVDDLNKQNIGLYTLYPVLTRQALVRCSWQKMVGWGTFAVILISFVLRLCSGLSFKSFKYM